MTRDFIFHRHAPNVTFERSAIIQPSSLNEGERSVESVLSTPLPTAVYDRENWRIIDEVLVAGGAEFAESVALIDSHRQETVGHVIGSVRDIALRGQRTVGRLHFADVEDVQRTWSLVRDGHLREVSPGYVPLEFVDIKPGASVTLRGKKYTAGQRWLRVTFRWQIREVSLVVAGADPNARIRSGNDSLQPQQGQPMPVALRQYLQTVGLGENASEHEAWGFYQNLGGQHRQHADSILSTRSLPATATVEDAPVEGVAPVQQAAVVPAQRAAEPVQSQPAVQLQPVVEVAQRSEPQVQQAAVQQAPQVDANAAVLQERARVEMCRQRAVEGVPGELVTRAINEGWSEARVGQEYLAALQERQTPVVGSAPAAHIRDHERDCTQRSLAAALLHRNGIDVVGTRFGNETLTEQDADVGERFSGMHITDFARECCRISRARDPETQSEPYTAEGFARAAVSTPALNHVFTTSVNASLLAGYEEEADTTDWCDIRDIPNFQEREMVRLKPGASLSKHARGGTAKHTSFSDQMETMRINRYSAQSVFDEMDFIDDNLDALSQTPRELGMAAKREEIDLIYAFMLANESLGDGNPLFSGNSLGNAEFSKVALEEAFTEMLRQTVGNKRIAMRPQVLIVAPGLHFTATELLQSSTVVAAGSTDIVRPATSAIPSLNLTLRTESRLDASGVTSPDTGMTYAGDNGRWYLTGPRGHRVIKGYRTGTNRRPQVRRFVLNQGKWGVGWDISHDIGVGVSGREGLRQCGP